MCIHLRIVFCREMYEGDEGPSGPDATTTTTLPFPRRENFVRSCVCNLYTAHYLHTHYTRVHVKSACAMTSSARSTHSCVRPVVGGYVAHGAHLLSLVIVVGIHNNIIIYNVHTHTHI